MKTIALTPQEKEIISKLSIEQLQELENFSTTKQLATIVSVLNVLLDEEKEWFLLTSEPDPVQLARKHAALQGGVLLFKKMLRIIKSAAHELQKRDEERKRKKKDV